MVAESSGQALGFWLILTKTEYIDQASVFTCQNQLHVITLPPLLEKAFI